MRIDIYRKHRHDTKDPRALHRGYILSTTHRGQCGLTLRLKEHPNAAVPLRILRGEILTFLRAAGYETQRPHDSSVGAVARRHTRARKEGRRKK